MAGLIGRKLDMTRVIHKDKLTPVTLIQIPELKVAQIKTKDNDGYDAMVIKMSDTKKGTLREVSITDKVSSLNKGDEISLDVLDGVDTVEVVGISKGKGFAGAIKRWHFSGGPGGHGSKFHRALGSIGCRKPRRTKPGKKMHGHMGNERVTIKKIPVVLINKELNVVALKGQVPGARNSLIVLNF